ncbi:extracellular solute-binding protein [Paenibacillus cremeus]|uniref:Extracellular solute-binding protein n=1 Tax=Paenibacillus cremeus TaxID=2163881 RepID=A0A559KGN8_9BACL|nr:extracellular solute-binding protein [Paenibacillus cremeus]TVY11297.1 extracellular solute-binding protein [Paenibacillus cremeus]
MKKTLSGWASASLTVVVAASMVAGCSTGGQEAGKTAAQQQQGDSNKDAKPLTIKMFAGLYNDVPDMNNAYWSEWQKRTNTKLDVEWVPDGDLNTKLDLLLASGDLPEVLASPTSTRPTLLNAIKNGAFWDLTPFLGDFSQYPNLKNNMAKDAFKYLSMDGKIYAVPRSRSRIDPGIKIRKDWLDKLSIPVPTTLDEYAAALKKIVNSDPDGNGKNDTLGLIGHAVIVNDGDESFAAGFGALDPTYNAEGGLLHWQLTPQYADMVGWFRGLYQDGVLPKEFAVMKKTQAEELYKTGRAASYVRSVWWDDEWEKSNAKTQPGAKILNLQLKGPKGDAVALQTGVSGGYYISKKVPEAKVKQLLKYFEYTASNEITDFAYYGLEGVHYKLVDGQKVLTDQGVKEVNTTSKGAGVLAYAKWGKVESAGGTKAFNDAKKKEVEKFDEIGKVNPFAYTTSDTWNSTWPKYENEWKSMVTKAIVGQVSMDEYKAYVDKIVNLPEMKTAFKEFATAYKGFGGK